MLYTPSNINKAVELIPGKTVPRASNRPDMKNIIISI